MSEPVSETASADREADETAAFMLSPKTATVTREPAYAPRTAFDPSPPAVVIEPMPDVLALEPVGPSGPGGSGGETDFEHHDPPPGPWVPPGAAINRSRYMDYLPGIYSRNDFMARYLLIFESILSPVERTVDNIPYNFDPALAPSDVLPWLGSWLGLALDERWPDARRRELIKSAAELYHWRGTKRGLSEFIRLYTGIVPEIIEPTLSQISSSRDLAFRFTVRLTVPANLDVDRTLLEQIIDAEKPAFAAGSLEIVRA